jgi:hypothetical protein
VIITVVESSLKVEVPSNRHSQRANDQISRRSRGSASDNGGGAGESGKATDQTPACARDAGFAVGLQA